MARAHCAVLLLLRPLFVGHFAALLVGTRGVIVVLVVAMSRVRAVPTRRSEQVFHRNEGWGGRRQTLSVITELAFLGANKVGSSAPVGVSLWCRVSSAGCPL